MVIAFFTSETCGPCKVIEPLFHSLSITHTNVKFLQIDTQKQYSIASQEQISATPTFKTYLNGSLFTEWKGADKSALENNLGRLLESARPVLKPRLRGYYSQSPISFARSPPLEKVLPLIPEGVIPLALLDSIKTFLSAKGDNNIMVPPLTTWAQFQRDLDLDIPNAWMVVDLLRAAMADKRVSGWFMVDGLDALSDFIRTVHKRDESEWQLRVVLLQFVCPVSGLLT
jgi:desumoylating isopeptidase 1